MDDDQPLDPPHCDDTATALTRLRHENEQLRRQLAAIQPRIDELERLADMDTLTPLPNRRCFVREVNRVVARTERYGDPAAIMFVDVDGLKAINDRHGHGAGDAALNHVAALLRRGADRWR
jgi:PleD family two-component response regulator